MKAKEFISEAIENKPDLDPLPATYVLPKLQNQDAYLQYRFGIALASARARVAGEIPFEPQSDFGENMAVIARSPEEEETLKMALKIFGPRGVEHQLTSKSAEPKDTQTTSPIVQNSGRRINRSS